MLLNRNEIEKLNLLTNTSEENYCAHSYDLTAQEIITLDNSIVTTFKILPQSMAILVSKEEFNLSKQNIVGFTTVKNTLSRKGLMAVNIGLVDPGYIGPISSILLNFGKEAIEIKKGDRFLRITFQKFKPLDEKLTPNCIQTRKQEHDDYVEQRKNEGNAFLDPSFLKLNIIKKDILDQAKHIALTSANNEITAFRKHVGSYVTNTSLVIAAIGLIFTSYFGYCSYNQSKTDLAKGGQNYKIEKKLDSLQTIITKLQLTNINGKNQGQK